MVGEFNSTDESKLRLALALSADVRRQQAALTNRRARRPYARSVFGWVLETASRTSSARLHARLSRQRGNKKGYRTRLPQDPSLPYAACECLRIHFFHPASSRPTLPYLLPASSPIYWISTHSGGFG